MKLIYILFLVVAELFASQLGDAVSLYNEGKYIQAYEKFYILHVENKKDTKVDFYLAKTMYNLGEYAKANKVLVSLYKKEPQNLEVKFYLAKVYFEQKYYTKSKDLFLQLQKKPYKIESKQYLKEIDKLTTLHKFFFLVSLGLTYDDNTHNNTYEPTTDYESFTLNNDTDTISDTYVDKMLYIGHNYKMPSQVNTTWDDALMLFHRNGIEHSDQNILYSSFESGPSIFKNGYVIHPKIILNDLNYASKHYMYAYGVGLKLSKNFFYNKLEVNFEFSIKKDKYIHADDKTKNDNVLLYKLNFLHKLNLDNIFKYAVSYKKVRKEFGSRVDINKNEYRYTLEYDREFHKDYMVALNATYEKRDFIDIDPSLGERSDEKFYYTGTISRKFKKFYNLSLKYRYIKNKSSINSYSYKKSTLGLTLSRYF